jgi:Arc/MetJ-type ribon-helix-helix transcriptional regulator
LYSTGDPLVAKWRKISIRDELVKDIERLIKLGRYTSVAEFIQEAVRLRLEEISKSFGLYTVSPEEAPESIVLAQKSG